MVGSSDIKTIYFKMKKDGTKSVIPISENKNVFITIFFAQNKGN